MTRDNTAHSGLGPPTLIIIQETPPWTFLQANMMEALSELKFGLPRRHWLCQVYKTLTRTTMGHLLPSTKFLKVQG